VNSPSSEKISSYGLRYPGATEALCERALRDTSSREGEISGPTRVTGTVCPECVEGEKVIAVCKPSSDSTGVDSLSGITSVGRKSLPGKRVAYMR
jgi:hypothetical protein